MEIHLLKGKKILTLIPINELIAIQSYFLEKKIMISQILPNEEPEFNFSNNSGNSDSLIQNIVKYILLII